MNVKLNFLQQNKIYDIYVIVMKTTENRSISDRVLRRKSRKMIPCEPSREKLIEVITENIMRPADVLILSYKRKMMN